MHQNIGGGGGVVLNFGYLQLAFFHGILDALDKGFCGGAVGDFGDADELFGAGVQLGSAAQAAVAGAIVVAAHIQQPPGGEIRVKLEFLAAQVVNGGLNEFVEVMRQDKAVHAHGNAQRTLSQQQREFHGQGHGLLVAAIVAELPFRHLRAVHHFLGELGEAGFDVSRSSGGVAGENVAPVTLRVDEQAFLAEGYQRTADGCIAVRVVFHGVAHNVGHLVVAAVIHALHGMQNTALHGFQTVNDMRHSAFQNHIRGVFQIVIPEHFLNETRVFLQVYGCDVFAHGLRGFYHT